MAWVLLISGILAVVLCVWLWATLMPASAAEEECSLSGSCTETGFTLELNGYALSPDDLTKQECADAYEEISPQAPPFGRLQCVEYPIARQTS
jgi:hypothetical protein